MIALLFCSFTATAESSEDVPVLSFEAYRDQPTRYRRSLNTWGHVVDRSVKGRDRRLVAVTPDGPLTPEAFAAYVDERELSRTIDNLNVQSNALLVTQFGLLAGGFALVASDRPSQQQAGLGLIVGSIVAGGFGLSAQIRRLKTARFELAEARAMARNAGIRVVSVDELRRR